MSSNYLLDSIKNSTDRFKSLLSQVRDVHLCHIMQIEFENIIGHHQQLVNVIQEKNEIILDTQKKYEKAVREMQYYRKQLSIENTTRKRNNSITGNSIYSHSSSESSKSFHTSYSTPSTANSHMSIIQQRRMDPLCFGGSDALWDTISKSQGNDVIVEKIISNFLRRGGSPNTAKQSPNSKHVKYGYGMIHALIVTKSLVSLDLLLQQGANPNVISLSNIEEDKVSPCYLAASLGWLIGLQKIIQAGGDLISARGGGIKKKTALQIAAQNGHLMVVDYIMNATDGLLNYETDSTGASILHYGCLSGNTEIVDYIINKCGEMSMLNQVDNQGELAIHWATRYQRFEIVKLLIDKYSMNINACSVIGTVLDSAKLTGNKKLIELIKQHGGLTSKKLKSKQDQPMLLEFALTKNGFLYT